MAGRKGMLAGLVVAALLLVTAVASAHTVRYATSSSFGFASSPDQFFGEVHSPRAACVPGRTARVFRVKPGRDALVGSGRSSSTGQWTVKKQVPTARFYAKVLRKNIGRGGHRHICRAYRTSTLRFD